MHGPTIFEQIFSLPFQNQSFFRIEAQMKKQIVCMNWAFLNCNRGQRKWDITQNNVFRFTLLLAWGCFYIQNVDRNSNVRSIYMDSCWCKEIKNEYNIIVLHKEFHSKNAWRNRDTNSTINDENNNADWKKCAVLILSINSIWRIRIKD